ncbi:MAG: outer membrane protein assembly factor BamD [Thermodesulfobacteriota bacterium]|nr:outer membrane protein assembly factor BamD [Thermodesulfobacteriota bacterium]
MIPKNKLPVLLLLGVIVLLLLSGCGFFKGLFGDEGADIEVLPQQLAEEGMEAMREEQYETAAQKFQDLQDRYPYSRYAILAELKRADALFFKAKYIEAAEAYKEFERLHPKNEAVPYVIFQTGMCYFKKMPTHDRDQSRTIKAIQTFVRLRHTFPDSKWAAMAGARLTEAQKTLAGHEFSVGEFYFKQKSYTAALGRFTSLIKNYPDTGYHARAMNYISLCRQKIAEEEATAQTKTKEKQRAAEDREAPPDEALPSPDLTER